MPVGRRRRPKAWPVGKRRERVYNRVVEQRVRSLSIAILDRLAEGLLDLTEPADLQRWFARCVTQ